MRQQQGVALVLVLWVLSLLIIMAGSFALTMKRESAITGVIKNNAQALSVAESGIALAEIMTLGAGPTKAWRADGSIYEIITTQAKIRIRLISELGKIDINKAALPVLKRLMSGAPIDEELKNKLVAAIIDWRDADDLVSFEGAEKNEYEEAGLGYKPRNKPFQSTEELQLVLGMNSLILAWLEPMITVDSEQAQVNLQVATPEVLKVFSDLDSDLVNEFVLARLDSARNNLPAPILPIKNALGAVGQNQKGAMTIVTEALMDDKSRAAINVIVKKSVSNVGPPFQVLKWQLNTANNKSLFTNTMSQLLVKQYAEPELNN